MTHKTKPLKHVMKNSCSRHAAIGTLCAALSAFLDGTGIQVKAFAKQRFQQMPEIPTGLYLGRESLSQDKSETFVLVEPKEQQPLGTLHNWKICSKRNTASELRLSGQGQNLSAKLNFLMPQHQHGIGTIPKINVQITQKEDPLYADFSYCVQAEGIRFHMAGWWQLQFEVTQGQGTNTNKAHAKGQPLPSTSRFATFNWILP